MKTELQKEIEITKKRFMECQRESKSSSFFDGKLEGLKKGAEIQKKEDLKIIEDIDLQLFFTDIKTKDGKDFELSNELMELFRTFWDVHLRDIIKKQIQEGKE